MSNKITKKDRFNQLLEIQEVAKNADLVAFIEHELELLGKKSGKDKKPTKAQLGNESLKDTMIQTLKMIKLPATIEAIQANSDILEGYSCQKISALLRQLILANLVVRTEIEKKAHFQFIATKETSENTLEVSDNLEWYNPTLP